MAETETIPENTTTVQEESLDIPAALLVETTGFSIDIGGSMLKIVYATDEGATVRFHFLSFPRHEIEDGIRFLQRKIGNQSIKDRTIHTCGIGFQRYTNDIEDRLGVKLKVLNELDCFTDGYRYLAKTIPPSQMFYEESAEIKNYTSTMIKAMLGVLQKLDEFNEDGTLQPWEIPSETQSDEKQNGDEHESTSIGLEVPAVNVVKANGTGKQFPVLLAMLGSAAVTMLLEENGMYRQLEFNARCGRMFLGLGRILTKAETFQELVDLAARGNSESLNVCGKHLRTGVGDNIYSHMPDDIIAFCFGHAVTNDIDSVSREDLAATLLSSICQDLAQTVHLSAMVYGVKKIVFCGGFPGASQVVRDEIGKHLGVRCQINPQGIKYQYHFLRYGGYLGAFGALLRTLQGENCGISTNL